MLAAQTRAKSRLHAGCRRSVSQLVAPALLEVVLLFVDPLRSDALPA